MSEKHRNVQEPMSRSTRKIYKCQKWLLRRYLKRIRRRMRQQQRYFMYGLVLAAALYLAGVWKLRERIWSIREMDRIEYVIPEWGRTENRTGNTPAKQNTGETYGRKEETGTITKIRLHLKTGELEIVHERLESEEK